MTEKEKMLSGQLYMATDEEIAKMSLKSRQLLDQFNQTSFTDFTKRAKIAKKLFGSTGNNLIMSNPFYCDYGSNIYVGDNFYTNFDCMILDVCKVTIGNNVFFAPKVSIYTATHPIDAAVRATGLEYGKPVTIGDNVWVGGNAIINPGVTIGNNVVIGSGSVVTKDIPSNVIAAGNPCKIIRSITEEDKAYWQQKQQDYYKNK